MPATTYPWGGNNNYWDSTYGRGIGGPSSSTQTASYTTPTYTPPSQGTQQAQNSNMTASDYWDMARFAYGVYRDRNPPKPKFEAVPLSDEEREMYRIYMASMLNPATVNNAAALNQMATQMLGGMSGMQWQSPPTFSGAQGYGGSNLSFTPPVSGSGGGNWPMPGGGMGGDTPPSNQPAGSAPVPRGAGGVYGGSHAPLPPASNGTGANPMNSFFARYAGNWNQNEETYERWLARAASVVAGAMGVPVPPNLIDKGIDAAQWVYRHVTNRNTTPLPSPTRSLVDVAKDAPGTEYTPPTPLPKPSRTLADVAKDAPGTTDQYGNPPRQPQRPAYWEGYRTPYWNNPYGGTPAMPPQPWGKAYGGRNNRVGE